MGAFTTIAAGVGAATALGGGAMSFAQAGKARRQAEDAQRKSEKLMREARDRATKNVYDKLQVPLDAFGEQYRQGLATQTQQVEALQEGDARGLAAGIGKVGATAAAAQEQTRIGMQDSLYDLAKIKADAEEDVKQQEIKMDVGRASSLERKAADLEKVRAAAVAKGISSVGKGGIMAAGAIKNATEDLDADELKMLMAAMGMSSSGSDEGSAGGKIICVEIYKQGYMPKDIFVADEKFGVWLMKNRWDVFAGYHIWAPYVVDYMRNNPDHTKYVAWFLKPWTHYMASKMGMDTKFTLRGKLFNWFGVNFSKLCYFLYGSKIELELKRRYLI